MEFGQLTTKELEKLTFKLPRDPAVNEVVLKKAKKGKTAIFLGCAKWGRREWIGKIYPKGTKEKDFLNHYAQHYHSIELNATNYTFYDPNTFRKWLGQVNNPNFTFCPKAHRAISFMKPSPNKKKFTDLFIKSIQTFGDQLGPVFMTLNGPFNPEYAEDFYDWLAGLPDYMTFFVEQRDPQFYANKKLQNSYYSRLRELGIGAVITDTAGRQDVLHMNLTIPKAFIRFVGNSLHPSDYPRVDQWATRINKWIEQGIEEIYFFMHMHDEGKSPELTQYVIEQINKKTSIQLSEVAFVK